MDRNELANWLGDLSATADSNNIPTVTMHIAAIREIRDALRQSAWRPMSEVPRDGTEVWTFNGEQGRMRFWSMPEWSGWCWADDVLNGVDPSPEQPTAWQPLPPPPADEVICNR